VLEGRAGVSLIAEMLGIACGVGPTRFMIWVLIEGWTCAKQQRFFNDQSPLATVGFTPQGLGTRLQF